MSSSWKIFGGQLQRLGQPDDVGHVFRAGPAALFLMPADQKRAASRAALDIQSADALRGVDLVAGKRQHVHVLKFPPQVDRNLADRLRRVGVKNDGRVGFLRQPREPFDRENHAGFVVGVHDCDQQRVGPQRADELADVQIAVAIDAQESHVVTFPLQVPCRLRRRPDVRRPW